MVVPRAAGRQMIMISSCQNLIVTVLVPVGSSRKPRSDTNDVQWLPRQISESFGSSCSCTPNLILSYSSTTLQRVSRSVVENSAYYSPCLLIFLATEYLFSFFNTNRLSCTPITPFLQLPSDISTSTHKAPSVILHVYRFLDLPRRFTIRERSRKRIGLS